MDYDSPTRGGGRGGLRGNREDGGEFNFRGNSDGFEFEFSFRFNRVGVPSSTRGGFRGGRGGVSKFNGQKRKFDEEGEEKSENEPINKKEKVTPVDKKGKIEESDEDEEMDEEDDEGDDEVYEDEDKVSVPTKDILKKDETKSIKKVHMSKPSTPDTVVKTTPLTPHSKGEDAVKTVKLNFDEEEEDEESLVDEEVDEEEEEEPLAKTATARKPEAKKEEPIVVKKATVAASADVISDQEKRLEEDNKKTLFLKGIDRTYDKGKIKALHALIIGVRRRDNKCDVAFLKFASEANVDKAYPALSKVKGLTVDFCGQKSKTRRTLIEIKSTERKIDPTLLCVRPIVGVVSRAQLKDIFKTASDVKIPNFKGQTDKYALIRFESEEEALSVFRANKALKINGAPVSVLFVFPRATAEKKEAPKQTAAAAKKVVEASDDEEESEDDEEISSSDVKIEDEDEEKPLKKKADLTKPTPAKKVKKEPKKEEVDE